MFFWDTVYNIRSHLPFLFTGNNNNNYIDCTSILILKKLNLQIYTTKFQIQSYTTVDITVKVHQKEA